MKAILTAFAEHSGLMWDKSKKRYGLSRPPTLRLYNMGSGLPKGKNKTIEGNQWAD